jgi:hypothetical protein
MPLDLNKLRRNLLSHSYQIYKKRIHLLKEAGFFKKSSQQNRRSKRKRIVSQNSQSKNKTIKKAKMQQTKENPNNKTSEKQTHKVSSFGNLRDKRKIPPKGPGPPNKKAKSTSGNTFPYNPFW